MNLSTPLEATQDKMRGTTILLIEDVENDALLLRRAFSRAGFVGDLHWVASAEEASKYLRGEGLYSDRLSFPFPNVIICDLMMKGTSGIEFLKWAKEQAFLQDVPVCILSGSENENHKTVALELGAADFLVKGTDFSQCVENAQLMAAKLSMKG